MIRRSGHRKASAITPLPASGAGRRGKSLNARSPSLRADGRYVTKVIVGRSADGTAIHRPAYGFSEQACIDRAAEMMERASESSSAESDVRLAALLEAWLVTLEKDPDVSPRTKKDDRYQVDHSITPFLGRVPLWQLDAARILAWRDEQFAIGRGSRTVELSQDVLSSALARAVRTRLMPTNPCRTVGPVGHRMDRPLPRALHEARAFMAALEEPKNRDWRVQFQLMATSGVRLSEALGPLWEDVDLAHDIIIVTNTLHVSGRERAIIPRAKSDDGKRSLAISAVMSAILAGHRDVAALAGRTPGWVERGVVFPSTRNKGQAGRQDSSNHAFHRICDQAGLRRIRVQDLRRLGLGLHHVA